MPALISSVLPESLDWRKSSYSQEGNCVELAALPGGDVAMRNSKRPASGVVVFTRSVISAFLQGAKGGEFDDMT
ncbi:MAG: DUF397 domain-containing protein [Acidimicrobiales bacterium]